MGSVKGVIILVLAVAVVGISLLLQPWSELGFGVEEDKVPIWAKGIVASPVYQSLKPLGNDITKFLTERTAQEEKEEGTVAQLNPLVIGNYSYAITMCIALILASIAIIAVGREDAEEKTVLPVKK